MDASIEKEDETGFYWIKTATIESVQIGVWQPAFFNGEGWELCGYDGQVDAPFIEEVKEKIICKYQPVRDDT